MEHKFPELFGLVLQLVRQGGSKSILGGVAGTQVSFKSLLAGGVGSTLLTAVQLVCLFGLLAGLIEPRGKVFKHFIWISTRI